MVQTLFAENVYADTPVMRGVYFTSGTQEGSPIDRVMNAMADAFGIRRRCPPAASPRWRRAATSCGTSSPTSSSRTRIWRCRARPRIRRQRQLQYAYAGGALFLALLILLFPTIAFFRNREMIQDTRKLFLAQKDSQASTSTASIAVEDLRVLRDRLDELLKWEDEGPPTGMRFGMYRGSALFEPLRKFYGAAVRRTFVEPVLAQDMKDLTVFAKKHEGEETTLPDEREYARYFSMLKLNLLLTGPRTEAEPQLGDNERAWIVANLVSRWANRSGFAESADRQRILGEHLDLYVKLLAQEPVAGLHAQRQGHQRHARRPGQAPLRAAAAQPDHRGRGPRGGPEAVQHPGRHRLQRSSPRALVRGAFTRKGWDKVVRDRLESPLQNADLWVLSRTTKDSTDAEIERIIKRAVLALLRAVHHRVADLPRLHRGGAAGQQRRGAGGAGGADARQAASAGAPVPGARVQHQAAEQDGHRASWGTICSRSSRTRSTRAPPRTPRTASTRAPSSPRPPRRRARSLYTAPHVQAAFDSLVKFGVAPPPAAPDAPPESVQLDLYQEQLVFIRDALRQFLENPSEGKALNSRLGHGPRADPVAGQRPGGSQHPPGARQAADAAAWTRPPRWRAARRAPRSTRAGAARSWTRSSATWPTATRSTATGMTRRWRTWASSTVPASGTMWGYFDDVAEGGRAAGG